MTPWIFARFTKERYVSKFDHTVGSVRKYARRRTPEQIKWTKRWLNTKLLQAKSDQSVYRVSQDRLIR